MDNSLNQNLNTTTTPSSVVVKTSKMNKMFIVKPINIIIVYGILGLIAVFVFAAGIYYLATNGSDEGDKLNEEERTNLVTEVIKNNPKTTVDLIAPPTADLGNTVDTVTETIGDAFVIAPKVPTPKVDAFGNAAELDPLSVAAPDLNLYNYRKNTYTYTKGSAFERCIAFSTYYGFNLESEKQINEAYSYYETSKSYYKNLSKTETGELVDMQISKYSKSENEFYAYANGKFAAKTLYKINPNFNNVVSTISSPTSYTSPLSYIASYPDSYSLSNVLSNYFGTDVVVTSEYSQNDKNYLEFRTSYKFNCGNGLEQGYSVSRMNKADYVVDKISIYFGTINSDNLFYTYETKSEYKNIKPSDASTIFKLADNLAIRTIDYRNYGLNNDSKAKKIATYMTQNNIALPEVSGYKLSSISGKSLPEFVENTNYYRSRDFYSSTSLGQKMYDRVQSSLNAMPDLAFYLYRPNYYEPSVPTGILVDVYLNTNMSDYENLIASSTNLSQSDFFDSIVYINGMLTQSRKTLTAYSYKQGPISYPISYAAPDSFGVISSYPESYLTSYPTSYTDGSVTFNSRIAFQRDTMVYDITATATYVLAIENINFALYSEWNDIYNKAYGYLSTNYYY